LVIKAKQTRRDAARQAIAILQQADAYLLGGVLNQVSQKRGSYYYRPSKTTAAEQTFRRQPRRRWQWLSFFR